MLSNLLKKIFGSRNDRMVKQYFQAVRTINELESAIAGLSDTALRAKTDEFKQRIHDGESLDVLLPEAFAVVREVGKRVLEMRHFDVQLIGGMVLHEGKIVEENKPDEFKNSSNPIVHQFLAPSREVGYEERKYAN